MRGAAPKAAEPPRLDLYALAQANVERLRASACADCSGCPGPEDAAGCRTRRWNRSALGRSDWPKCPLAMLREPAWQAIRDVFDAAQASAISGWPEAYPDFVVRGVTELKVAALAALKEEAKKKAKAPPGGPEFPGLASAKVTP